RRYRARPVPKSTAAHPAAKGAVPSWRGQAHQADRFPPLPPSDTTAKGRTVVSARASLGVENRRRTRAQPRYPAVLRATATPSGTNTEARSSAATTDVIRQASSHRTGRTATDSDA